MSSSFHPWIQEDGMGVAPVPLFPVPFPGRHSSSIRMPGILVDSMTTETDDGVLWSRAATGDRASLGMLLTRHAERVRTSARAAGLAESDAVDAVQEPFARELLHWRYLNGPDWLGVW